MMYCITGIIDNQEGSIIINGKNLKTNKSIVNGKLGFCLQNDYFYEEFTVRQYTNLILMVISISPIHSLIY